MPIAAIKWAPFASFAKDSVSWPGICPFARGSIQARLYRDGRAALEQIEVGRTELDPPRIHLSFT